MGKIAYVFPGQGSQHLGMAGGIYGNFREARKFFERANCMLEDDIIEMCLHDSSEKADEEFSDPMKSHPAIFLTSSAYLEILKGNSRKDWHIAIGNSFGQCTAIYAADAIGFEENLKLVKRRAEYMKECGYGSGMAAIIGKGKIENEINEICRQSGAEIALINSDCQFVIGGMNESLEKACAIAREMGYRTFPVRLQGTSHTTLLRPAAEKLGNYLDSVEMRKARKPIIANSSASYVSEPEDIKRELKDHLCRTVLFKDCVRKAVEDGTDAFIEIGPDNLSSRIISRMYPQVRTFSTKNCRSMEETLMFLE